MQKFEGFVNNEAHLYSELEKLGIKAETVAWECQEKIDFESPSLIRTTWNYTEHLDGYLKTLKRFASGKLWNPYEVVEWNSNKVYLEEIAKAGVETLPTLVVESDNQLEMGIGQLDGNDFIIKPTIGASASGLIRFNRSEIPRIHGPHLLQPFIPEITLGEVSLFYFGEEFRYAIKKVPKAGDIRVQEEYGGILSLYDPTQRDRETAEKAISLIPGDWLYARVDIIPGVGVIELECIEPSLYFNTYPEGAKILAKLIRDRLF